MEKALKQSPAKLIYVCNLVTKPGQTDNFTVDDFASEIERFIRGRKLDFVLYNTAQPNPKLVSLYQKDGEQLVMAGPSSSKGNKCQILGFPLIASSRVIYSKSDKIAKNRSFIRHNPDLLAQQIIRLV
jgi:2-phospho-L-lactate transferase/gluconeogenesis factor (CofD/UPF0052 family)